MFNTYKEFRAWLWREVQAEAKRHNATVSQLDGLQSVSIYVSTPAGKAWQCNGLHGISARFDAGTWRTHDAAEELLGQMRMGVMDCRDPDCDVCRGD